MPTSLWLEMTSKAPTPYSAIFSIASKTDWSGDTERTLFSPLLFKTNSILSAGFIRPPYPWQSLPAVILGLGVVLWFRFLREPWRRGTKAETTGFGVLAQQLAAG